MIEFEFTEDQKMLRDTVREFVNAEIKRSRRKSMRRTYSRAIDQELGEMGLMGAAFPPEYGGGGFGEIGYCIVQEEIGRQCFIHGNVHGSASIDRSQRDLYRGKRGAEEEISRPAGGG